MAVAAASAPRANNERDKGGITAPYLRGPAGGIVSKIISLKKARLSHVRASRSKLPKSSAVTDPPVSTAIRSASEREGQPDPSQSCVTLPFEMPTRRAKSLRAMPFDRRYSANFMEQIFRPAKIDLQDPVLAGLHGQAAGRHENFSMPKAKQKQPDIALEQLPAGQLQPTFIKAWRKKKGLTQTQLGESVGVSTATISQIENSNTPYTQTHLERIAAALGCTPCDLLMRHPDDPEGIWSLWQRATPDQRARILGMIEGFLGADRGRANNF